ncbi:MAG: hypothetical protein DRO73_11775, partial [Candidatus Thorarchaeota archaeon]
MKMKKQILPVILLIVLFAVPMLFQTHMSPAVMATSGYSDNSNGKKTVDLGDGTSVELGPNEELHKFILTEQGWVEWQGISDSLAGGEYGNRSDTFQDRTMRYYTNGSTSGVGVDVPTGTDWETYHVETVITSLTENRTWVKNPDFSTNIGTDNWTTGTLDSGSYSTPAVSYDATGDATGGGCIDLEINS